MFLEKHVSQKVEVKQRNKDNTLAETDVATENRPSQKETRIPTIHFQVLC